MGDSENSNLPTDSRGTPSDDTPDPDPISAHTRQAEANRTEGGSTSREGAEEGRDLEEGGGSTNRRRPTTKWPQQ